MELQSWKETPTNYNFSQKNLDYEIMRGARRQERRWDPTENEQVVPEDKEVSSVGPETHWLRTHMQYTIQHSITVFDS